MRLARRPGPLTGREDLLADLHQRLGGPAAGSPRIAVLHGLGGVGKTSLALEYAHRHATSLSLIWQLAAEDPLTLQTGFSELAAALGTDDRDPVTAAHRVLADRAGGWLLLFDNVTTAESLRGLVPPAGHGQVLITTQSPHWPADQAITVPVLDNKTSADFLAARVAAERPVAEAVAAELGGLPLALEQAAAYLAASGLSMADYLDLLTTRRAELLSKGRAAGYDKQVITTWSLAFDQLKSTPTAIGLLRLLACCAPESIPYDLLLRSSPNRAIDPQVASLLRPLLGDKLAVADAVAALRSFSLIGPPAGGTVSMHRLVRAVTLAGLPPEEAPAWRDATAKLIETALPADPELPASWPAYAALSLHAQMTLDPASTSLSQVADYLRQAGSFAAARDLCRSILNARRSQLGPDHPDALAVRNDLAYCTGVAGDPASAWDQLTALLRDCQRILGPDHPETLDARNNLAYWTGEAGDPASARDQLTALLPDRQRILGPDHPHTLITRNNLAYCTGEAGDPAAARDQLTALLHDCQRILGPDHPGTLDPRDNLAGWTGEAGDPASARDQLTALLRDCQRILGPDHPDTLTARNNLAYWTGKAGDPAAARDQLTTLLRDYQRILGPDHPQTLITRNNLVYWTEAVGEFVRRRRSRRG